MAEYTIDKIEYDGNVYNLSPNVVYATCSTAAATAAKVATITSGTLTSLNAGDQVIVKFTYANGKASPTLKVGSTDAKSIMRYGTTAPSTSAASSWNAGSCVWFVYDGTYWQMAGWVNTTYSEISAANITNGSGSSTGLVTGRRAKAAVEAFQTDEKLEIDGTITSGTTYYPIIGRGTTAAVRQHDETGLTYSTTPGTTEINGESLLAVGNNISTGTTDNKRGYLQLFGYGNYSVILGGPTSGESNYYIALPGKAGTVALTSDIPNVSGKIDTAGTGLSKSGTTLNHSNSVTAQTTQAVYPIKIDAQGHISAYGSAVTIPTIPSNNVTGSGSADRLAVWSDTYTLSSKSLSVSSSYNSSSDSYGTIKLYVGSTGQIDWKGQLVFYDGYSKAITITPPSLTGFRTITLPDKTGTVALTSDIPDVSSFITDAGVTKITTTAGAHTAITNATGAVSFNVPTTAAHVGAASSSHTHGNITNGGDITATAPTIASGDQIIINDHSASKITNGPTFDGSTTTTALTPKGTWETFSKFSGSYNDLSDKPTIPTNTDEKIKLTSQSTSGTYPLIFGPTSITSNSTYQGYYNTGITVNPSTKTVTATTFVGALTGTASGNLTSSSTLDATKLSGTIPSSCYTNTTYGISGSLSNHAFTSTLTAGGSGTTSVLTLAAGTGITLTDDTTNKKITIACSVTNTDTKVSTAAVTSETTYYPVLGSDTTSAATKYYDKTGISYIGTSGSGSTSGEATLTLGNNVAGSSGKCGYLDIYGIGQYKATLRLGSPLSANRLINLPDKTGTIALTSDVVHKPPGDGDYGWVLKYSGPSSTFWDVPSGYRFTIREDENNPGTYAFEGDEPSNIQNILFSGTNLILELDLLNTDIYDIYTLTDYYTQEIPTNDGCYYVLWFTGIFRKTGTSHKKITVGIYLDELEVEHAFGEITVTIDAVASAGIDGSEGMTIGDWKICWGSVSLTTTGASGSGTYTAPYYVNSSTISLNYTALPYVWCQVMGGWTGSRYATPYDIDETGFKIRLYASHKNSTDTLIRWLAIGKA